MPFVFSFRSKVIMVKEKFIIENDKKVSIGWFVQLEEFAESIKVAEPGEANKPDVNANDIMMVTWRNEGPKRDR